MCTCVAGLFLFFHKNAQRLVFSFVWRWARQLYYIEREAALQRHQHILGKIPICICRGFKSIFGGPSFNLEEQLESVIHRDRTCSWRNLGEWWHIQKAQWCKRLAHMPFWYLMRFPLEGFPAAKFQIIWREVHASHCPLEEKNTLVILHSFSSLRCLDMHTSTWRPKWKKYATAHSSKKQAQYLFGSR